MTQAFSRPLNLRLIHAVREVAPEAWDACAAPEAAEGGRPANPFLTHRFFLAMEESGSAVPRAGWAAHHLIAEAEGRLVGILPVYLKSDSQGEYVFDHGWAQAYERAGGSYYPKLVSATPFTPVPGRRLLIAPGAPEETARALARAGRDLATNNGLSSLHVNFCLEAEQKLFEAEGFLPRLDLQYHWRDEDYGDYAGFLGALASRKRKALKKEREAAQAGLEILRLTGEALRPEHWDAMWGFYQDTGARKWGRPYLTREAFRLLAETMAEDCLIVLAREAGGGPWLAGALNLIGRETLYGRYWGALEERPFLHFEICYHQAIEAALEMGLKQVEAGAQGEHKLARGYRPILTRSAHWISDPGLRKPVADYLKRERASILEAQAELDAATPFRRMDEGPASGEA
ncbi:GNAT family N-acetyltransferase [Neomegalonema perideroedes]|uniref:GNAT family N-acetyltransferase n=1 Tax=Neomegalonema perideroedes TaxID=217219 RepID=UPI0012FE09AB